MYLFDTVLILITYAALVPEYAWGQTPADPFEFLSANTSVLLPGWSGAPECLADCTFTDTPIRSEFLFGPAFSDTKRMTIELCVAFCDAQGLRLAGLKSDECRCANIFNPSTCFESDFGECELPFVVGVGCPGDRRESCGSATNAPPLFNIFFKRNLTQFGCSDPLWPGGAPLSAIGSWRFSYFYNDSGAAHALSQDAAELPNPPLGNNLTTVACVTACDTAGFTLAGLKAGNQCFCGNTIENGASPVTDCPKVQPFEPGSSLTQCSGRDFREFCGGTDVIAIYTLPGTGLVPVISFDPGLNGFCSAGDCVGNT